MKKISFLYLLIFTLCNYSCERDDICPNSTPTTPSLIIRAFDVNNIENKKNIFGLTAKGIGNSSFLEGHKIVNKDSLVLPLNTKTTSTSYKLYRDSKIDTNNTIDESDDFITSGNEDIITINYSTELVYVSRACGYKTIFKNVTLTIESDTDNWIKSRQPLNDNQSVENEKSAHFYIFH